MTRAREAYGPHPRQVGDWWLPGERRRAAADGGARARRLLAPGPGTSWLEDDVAADLAGRGLLVWNVNYRPSSDPWPATLTTPPRPTTTWLPRPRRPLSHGRRRPLRRRSPRPVARLPGAASAGAPGGAPLVPPPALAVAQAPVADLAEAARLGLGSGAVAALLGGGPAAAARPAGGGRPAGAAADRCPDRVRARRGRRRRPDLAERGVRRGCGQVPPGSCGCRETTWSTSSRRARRRGAARGAPAALTPSWPPATHPVRRSGWGEGGGVSGIGRGTAARPRRSRSGGGGGPARPAGRGAPGVRGDRRRSTGPPSPIVHGATMVRARGAGQGLLRIQRPVDGGLQHDVAPAATAARRPAATAAASAWLASRHATSRCPAGERPQGLPHAESVIVLRQTVCGRTVFGRPRGTP